MIKKWKVTAEINMDASRYASVEVKANTERKARKLGEQKLLNTVAFFVTNTKVEEVKA